ncbi:MAG: 16S rRNA (uracil(1498)-N(3))-methyltransferase [Luminiphilus sp.]|nr:16S rRNA (uracil(1498)-N(3))-methyltransferase [Luminiphilus sp.]
MREIRLHTKQSLEEGNNVQLEAEAAHYLVKVLRVRVGDTITLFNGSGLDWRCAITEVQKRAVTLAVGSAANPDTESLLKTHLGLCLSKGDRFDWAIQKATEAGVTTITPLYSDRVDVKLPSDRIPKRIAHWQQIVRSACEQCGRTVVPQVFDPTPLSNWAQEQVAETKLFLHHRETAALPETRPSSVALLVGPEGGLSDIDRDHATDAGFVGVKFGPRVLRTETAPLVALSILGARWGDMGQF